MPTEPQAAIPIRILLVDDHPAVREGLALLLASEGITVCATSTSADILSTANASHPNLALVNLSQDEEDGLLLVDDLQALVLPVLVFSMHEDVQHVESALAAGALGYVTKREQPKVLVDAIREVAAGRRFISPNAARILAEYLAVPTTPGIDRKLGDQEHQVYHLIGQGEGTRMIADAMGISPRTVESYYTRIQDKLGLTGMRELRRHAIANHHA